MENANFDFRLATLSDQDLAAYNAIGKEAAEKAGQERQDYAQNRDVYIAAEEESRILHHKKQLEMPVPKGFPQPRMPSAERIRQEAADRVREGHEKRLKDIADDARKREREFILNARGLAEKGRAGPERGQNGHER